MSLSFFSASCFFFIKRAWKFLLLTLKSAKLLVYLNLPELILIESVGLLGAAHCNHSQRIHGKVIPIFYSKLLAYRRQQQVKLRSAQVEAELFGEGLIVARERDSLDRLYCHRSALYKTCAFWEAQGPTFLPEDFYYECFLSSIAREKWVMRGSEDGEQFRGITRRLGDGTS